MRASGQGEALYVWAAAISSALILLGSGGALFADEEGAQEKAAPRGGAPAKLLSAGPLLGYDGHQTVRVWASPLTSTARLEVAIAEETPAPGEPAVSRLIPMPPVADGASETTLRIDGLRPRTRYVYQVRADGVASEATTGAFTTGPLPGKPVAGVIGVVSCMHAKRWTSQKAWLALRADKPDLLLSIGDNIYANSVVPETIREWYTLQRNVPEYAPLVRDVPQLAIWDDHDYGANDSDGTLKGKERSLETFRALWPNPSYGLPDAPGVFHASSFGDVDIFLLDGRWYRSPNLAPDDESKRMLGEAQFRWLEEKVKASKATFKLIISGSTIYTGMKDSWKGFSSDRRRLISLTQTVPGIVFVVGDIHTGALLRLEEADGAGYPYYELVSSGVAVNPSLFFYATIAVDTVSSEKTLTIRIRTLDKEGTVKKTDETVIKRSELVPGF